MYTDRAKYLMKRDPKFLEDGIVKIYQNQTKDEQGYQETYYLNGKGFNQDDAELLSYYAGWILDGKHLTDDMRRIATSRMEKYAKQLTDIINGQSEPLSPVTKKEPSKDNLEDFF